MVERTVSIPNGVMADVVGMRVTVKGPKGQLEQDFASPVFGGLVKLEKADGTIKVSTAETKRKFKSEAGTVAAGIHNMMRGVTEGWTYRLKIVFLHFPVTVKAEKDIVSIANFLGEKAARKAKIVGNTKVDIKGEDITLTGINLEEVGQTAANLERASRIPARDRRVYQDGIFITEKPK
jgi:large subunit ribosomal protein L6